MYEENIKRYLRSFPDYPVWSHVDIDGSIRSSVYTKHKNIFYIWHNFHLLIILNEQGKSIKCINCEFPGDNLESVLLEALL